jgi:hypothetical protein
MSERVDGQERKIAYAIGNERRSATEDTGLFFDRPTERTGITAPCTYLPFYLFGKPKPA